MKLVAVSDWVVTAAVVALAVISAALANYVPTLNLGVEMFLPFCEKQ